MRVMAIDYGDARTGIAVSDPTGTLVSFASVLSVHRLDLLVEQIAALARERGAEELVLGYPKNMNGTAGPRAEKAEELAEKLRGRTGLEVALWDERLTTVDAWNILHANGRHAKKGKQTVDAVAASLILESYLAARKG